MEDSIFEAQKLLDLESEVDALLRMHNNKELWENDITQIDKVLQSIDLINEKIEKYTNVLSIEKDIQPILTLYSEIEKFEKDQKELTSLITVIGRAQTSIDTNKENLDMLEKVFNKLLSDKCPLCEQKIPHKHEK